MSTTVTCPYCNSPVTVPPGERRFSCPRCEETVTVGDNDISPRVADAPPLANTPAAPPRPTNRAIGGVVVAVMVGMAAVALAFALRTTGLRRANDAKGVQEPDVIAESRPTPPAEWPGLGYLPEGEQAVAGVRLSAALESPAGRALLGQFGVSDNRQAKVLGVPPSDIETILFGASLRALPPRVTAVVHGRRPIGDRTRPPSGTVRTTEQHGKTLTRGKLWPNGPDGATWRADDHTLVATLLPEDMDKVPATPRVNAPLADLLARLDPAALAWLVASVDDNSAVLGLVTGFIPLPPVDREAWAKLQAVAVSVRADDTRLTLTLHVRGRDAAAGDAIATAVADSLTKAGVSVQRRAGSRERPEDWQQLTATADAEKITAWVSGLRK